MDVPTNLDPPTARGPFSGYSIEHRPLAGYAILTAAFGAGVAGTSAVARAAGREPPSGSVRGTWSCSDLRRTSSVA